MKWPNECVIETLKTGNDVVLVVLLTHLMTCVPISFFMTWKTKLQLFLTRLRGKYIDCTEKYYRWSLIIIGIPMIKDWLYILVYYLVFHTYAFACLSTYMHLCNSLQLPVHPSPFFPTHLKVPWKKKGRAKVE